MKRYLTIGLIAGAVLAAAPDANAQTRRVFCQPRPICFNGQISVCKFYGDSDDACACKSWSGCFGGVRTPPATTAPLARPQQAPLARPQQPRIIPPRIEIPPVR